MTCPHCNSKYATPTKRKWSDGKYDWMCSSCGRQVPEPEGVTILKPQEQPEAGAVVLYDRMVLAINECHQTDEVKNIRDQALALETYARQAQNLEAERKAIEIRIRAERKAGELLKEAEKGKGGRNSAQAAPSLFAQAKEQAKISDDQAKRWQKLAEIPKEEFEQALSDPETMPSTSGLVKSPLFKPLSDIPPPKPLDEIAQKRCTASCCPQGATIPAVWAEHDAQAWLDRAGYRHGHFGADHPGLLRFLVDFYHTHLASQLGRNWQKDRGEIPRLQRYDGIVLR